MMPVMGTVLSIQLMVLLYVLYNRVCNTGVPLPTLPTLRANNIDTGLSKPVFNEPTRPAVLPINMEQDVIPTYKQIGFVHQENSEEGRLPLYGRAKYQGSDQWEYYVQDGSRNHIRIPLDRGPRNNELYDDDTIQIDSIEGDYVVSLYPRQKIRYIPYVF